MIFAIYTSFNEKNKVVPSHKKGPTNDVNNYRPISLLSIFSKLLEKLMVVRLTTYLELNEIIYPNQFGLRPEYSNSCSLVSLKLLRIPWIITSMDVVVFIDLKKAFDTVNHEILLQKLGHYSIHGLAFSWFKSYLIDRRQYVHINGINSETKKVICGMPQGSVLGPLPFLLYINDLQNISKKLKFYLFNIYLESDDLLKLEKTMNKELLKLHDWLCIRLSLNITKTNFVIFHSINKPKFL